MKLLLFICLFYSYSLATERTLPDLIIRVNSGFGGYGRLIYSEAANRYHLLDGRINSYVIEGTKLRRMRTDEGGGMMANPETLVSLGGKLFGSSILDQINQYDESSGEIVSKYPMAEGKYHGDQKPILFASEKSLLALNNFKVLTLDSNLQKIGEARFEDKAKHVKISSSFIQSGAKLYDIEIDNPGTYSECDGDCRLPIVIRQTTIDFEDPAHIKIANVENEIPKSFYFTQKAVLKNGWILVQRATNPKQTLIEFRPFTQLAQAQLSHVLPVDTEIISMTRAEPLLMVLKDPSGYHLTSLSLGKNKIILRKSKIDWLQGPAGSFVLETGRGKLFISEAHRLAVYAIDGEKLIPILKQEFLNTNKSGQFQTEALRIVDLAFSSTPLNRADFSSRLKKSYWNDLDKLALTSDLEKLKPSDLWAIPMIVDLVKTKRNWHNGGMEFSLKALRLFGSQASEVLPLLLKDNIGSSSWPQQRVLAFQLIKTLDPTGAKTMELTKEYLEDAFKVISMVELLELIASPASLELARKTKIKWQLK